jgi:hypothetical protein
MDVPIQINDMSSIKKLKILNRDSSLGWVSLHYVPLDSWRLAGAEALLLYCVLELYECVTSLVHAVVIRVPQIFQKSRSHVLTEE